MKNKRLSALTLFLGLSVVVFALTACTSGKPSVTDASINEPSELESQKDAGFQSTKKAEGKEIQGEPVSISGPYGSIMIEVPEEWDCQAVSVGEDCLQSGLYGFILKPKESTEGQIELTCQDRFAVCGTGLSEEKITLAGKTATMGTFDNHSHWDFIVFGDDSPEIVAESYDCDTWNTKQWKDVLNLIDTLRFDPAQAEGGIGQFIQESEDDEIGVIMEIEQVSSKGATVYFQQYDQNTNEELTYGQEFSLEKKKGEKWEKLPTVIREYGFEDIGYTIPFGDKSVWKTDWTWLYGELSPGTYRMKKEVLEGTGNNRKTHELYAQFMIASQEK